MLSLRTSAAVRTRDAVLAECSCSTILDQSAALLRLRLRCLGGHLTLTPLGLASPALAAAKRRVRGMHEIAVRLRCTGCNRPRA
jgi:hypothetical protein